MLSRLWYLARNARIWLALLTILSTPALAQTENQAGRVSLIAASDGVGSASNLQLGVAFDLKPGWKIYWRFPGDAGYPPKVTWDHSTNIGTPVQLWPAPHRALEGGLQTIGYSGSVVLPLIAPLTRPGQPVHLQAQVDYLACEKICVPLNADLSLDLPAGTSNPSIHAHRLAQALAQVPGPPQAVGWNVTKAQIIDQALVVTLTVDAPLNSPDLLIEDGRQTAYPPPSFQQSGHTATLIVTPFPSNLVGQNLTVTLVDGQRAAEMTLAPTAGSADRTATLWVMAGIALVGGLVLNLMPCVLPILSIKLLSLLAHSGGHRLQARAAFLASSAGIVLSFLGLALILILLRSGGHAVGWGLQFQQPAFLLLMIAILTLFAANLWGLFAIPLPAWAGRLGTGSNSLLGHFLSGFFATLLATPCSAPFVGTAIGFALARGPQEIVTIFLALGIGMALPFLGVALWPELAIRLPHPGPWMNVVRRVLSVCLAATALWLGFVLMDVLSPSAAEKSANVTWSPFDPDRIAAEVAQGHVVLVDVTAQWCITCKVNKLTVIERGEVAQALKQPGTVAMQADWTKPDDAIARYLESFGRFGIPFDAVYGPGAPAGIALPELPTSAQVMSAISASR